MVTRWLCTVAAAAALALASGARAQTTQDATSTPEPIAAPAATTADDPNTGGLTLTGGVDWTSSYFFRGYNQEDTGLILQPYATLTANLYDTDAFDINLYGGVWNSFHSRKTLADEPGPSAWYESDAFVGTDFIIGKFTIGAIYTFYMYPNGAFETIQELGFKLSYDDTDTMKNMGVNFALKPYVGVYIETDDGNGTEDTYAEIGIGPSFALGNTGITLAVPVALGLSIDDYYLDSSGDNEVFGYGSISLLGSIPIPMPAKYGAWTLTAGVQYIQLFADSAEAANDGGTDYELLGKVGISFAY